MPGGTHRSPAWLPRRSRNHFSFLSGSDPARSAAQHAIGQFLGYKKCVTENVTILPVAINSPVALRVPLHDPNAAADHEPAAWLSPIAAANASRASMSVRQIVSVS
jgi:hypothetical protein